MAACSDHQPKPPITMKLNIKKITTIFAGAFAVVSLSSCLEQESTTKLSKDGSGTITENISVGAQMAGMMKAQGEEGGNEFTDEATYKTKAETMGEGVEFVGLKQKDLDNGGLQITATYKFADINKLKASMSNDDSGSDPITFSYVAGDTNKLTVNMPKKAAAEGGAEDLGEIEGLEGELKPSDEDKAAQKEQMKMMAGMMAGMRMSAFIEVDGEVVKTDADFSEGNKITLYDLEIGKIFANEKALDMLDSPDDMGDVNTMRELSKTIEGLKIEADDKIVVEFK